MNKEDIIAVAHLLSSLKENTRQLDEACKKKDAQRILAIKKEMVRLNSEVLKNL